MSYYQLGLSVPVRHSNPLSDWSPYRRAVQTANVGAWIATPGWLREQIERLSIEFETMGREMAPQLRNAIETQGQESKMVRFAIEVWSPLKRRWDTFEANHQRWYQNLWGNTWDNIKGFREQLVAVRYRAESIGYEFASPQPAPPDTTPWDTAGTLVKWAFAGVFGFVGLLLLKMLTDTFRR